MAFRRLCVCFLATLSLTCGLPIAEEAQPSPIEKADAALKGAVQALEKRGISVSVAVANAAGAPLLRHQSSRPLVPASTIKLLTTACALERLGPSWSTKTGFLAAEPVTPGGVLRGPLYVQAGGDPLLRGEDLWVAVQALVRTTGLSRIEGDLVVDASLFEGGERPASWPSGAVIKPYDAPQGAFAVGFSSTEVIVRPGQRVGAPARISLFPVEGVARITNRVKTGRRTRIDITLLEEESGPGRLRISGTIASARHAYRRWVRLARADAAGRSALVRLLEQAGVTIAGSVREGPIPDSGTLALHTHRSRSLAELTRAVNKYSSNFGSEILLRHLALADGAARGSTEAGLATLRGCAASWGLPAEEVSLHDGSGYSRKNRLSANALATLLSRAPNEQHWYPEWLVSLPRAGEDGSLRRRLEPWEGRLRAKTGSLSGVASLAGYAWTRDGERLAFAVILNGERGSVRTSDLDALLSFMYPL